MSTTPIDSSDVDQRASCRTDRSCGISAEATCGCGSSTPDEPRARRGAKAALLAVACAAVCLVVPLATGGVVALSGALAREWWVVGIALVAVLVNVTSTVRRRRTGRSADLSTVPGRGA